MTHSLTTVLLLAGLAIPAVAAEQPNTLSRHSTWLFLRGRTLLPGR